MNSPNAPFIIFNSHLKKQLTGVPLNSKWTKKKYIIKWTLLWEELHHQRQLFNFTSVHLSTKHVNQLTFVVPKIHFASLVRQDQWEMTKPWFGRGLLYSACRVNGIWMCTSSKECLWHILICSDPQDTLNKLTFLRHMVTELLFPTFPY